MSFLLEALLEVLSGLGFNEEHFRFAYVFCGALGLALAGAAAWTLWTWPDHLNEPEWSFLLLISSVLFGSIGIMAAGMHLIQKNVDRGHAAFCLASNLLAVVIPLFWGT